MKDKAAISENVSENRRGRPGVFDEAMLSEFRALWPEVKTRRGIVNKVYFGMALGSLIGDPHFEWLTSTEDKLRAGTGRTRETLLTALGRIENVEKRKAVAFQLCAAKPSTQKALAMIQGRRPTERRGSAQGLMAALTKTMNAYLQANVVTWEEIEAAVRLLTFNVKVSRPADETVSDRSEGEESRRQTRAIQDRASEMTIR